jgi:hypothetical protein
MQREHGGISLHVLQLDSHARAGCLAWSSSPGGQLYGQHASGLSSTDTKWRLAANIVNVKRQTSFAHVLGALLVHSTQRGQWWIQNIGACTQPQLQSPTPQLLQAEVLLAANKRQTASSSFWPLIVPLEPVLDIAKLGAGLVPDENSSCPQQAPPALGTCTPSGMIESCLAGIYIHKVHRYLHQPRRPISFSNVTQASRPRASSHSRAFIL